MKDTINITIQIADVDRKLSLPNIPRQEEEDIRIVENAINRLWTDWRARYPRQDAHALLAMVTFRFAQLYHKYEKMVRETNLLVEGFEKELDNILLDMNRFGEDERTEKPQSVTPTSDDSKFF